MIRKILYVITIINILFQIVYMTVGKYTTSDSGVWKYVFYVFRPEYMIVSGIIAILVGGTAFIVIIKSLKNVCFSDVIMLLLNIEYMIYYIHFIIKQ